MYCDLYVTTFGGAEGTLLPTTLVTQLTIA